MTTHNPEKQRERRKLEKDAKLPAVEGKDAFANFVLQALEKSLRQNSLSIDSIAKVIAGDNRRAGSGAYVIEMIFTDKALPTMQGRYVKVHVTLEGRTDKTPQDKKEIQQ